MTEKPQNHPGVAAVLSFLFNGLGQLYNGEIKKGLVIMTATSIALLVIIVGAIIAFHWILTKQLAFTEFIVGAIIFIVGIITACIIGYYSINDAYQKASQKWSPSS